MCIMGTSCFNEQNVGVGRYLRPSPTSEMEIMTLLLYMLLMFSVHTRPLSAYTSQTDPCWNVTHPALVHMVNELQRDTSSYLVSVWT